MPVDVAERSSTTQPQHKKYPRNVGRKALRPVAIVAALALAALLAWIFWPAIVPSPLAEGERPETGEAGEVRTRVEAVTVERRDFPILAEATGYLAPWRQVEVSAEISGRITERNVEEGRRVAAGGVLFRLDDADRHIELAEAEAELLQARAEFAVDMGLGDPNPLAPADTARFNRVREEFDAAQRAFERGEITEPELRAVQRRFEAAQILSGEQRGAMQAVRAGLIQAEQRVERARLALERTTIRAPFAGRVADIEVEQGQQVSAGQKLMLLTVDGRMKVEVDVLEADMVHMREGAAARVRVPSLGDAVFNGRIHTINPRVDTRTGTGRVTVEVPNPQGRLMAGLYAVVHLEARRLPDRLVIPAGALLVRQGRDLVFRIEAGRARWVYVTVGARSGGYVEILDGLNPGDLIATSGHFALAHDALVEVEG